MKKNILIALVGVCTASFMIASVWLLWKMEDALRKGQQESVAIIRETFTAGTKRYLTLWQEKILDFKPHVTVRSSGPGPVIRNETELAKQIAAVPGVRAVSPEIHMPVMLQGRGSIATPILMGVDSDSVRDVYKTGELFVGTFDLDGDSIVLGRALAQKLRVCVGDVVTIYSPKTFAAPDEIYLPLKWRVAGIYSSGRFDFDTNFAFCSLSNARELMGLEDGVFVLNVKADEPANPLVFDAVCKKIADIASPECRVESWLQTDREILNALAMESSKIDELLEEGARTARNAKKLKKFALQRWLVLVCLFATGMMIVIVVWLVRRCRRTNE